jgi:hypothetical protein
MDFADPNHSVAARRPDARISGIGLAILAWFTPAQVVEILVYT